MRCVAAAVAAAEVAAQPRQRRRHNARRRRELPGGGRLRQKGSRPRGPRPGDRPRQSGWQQGPWGTQRASFPVPGPGRGALCGSTRRRVRRRVLGGVNDPKELRGRRRALGPLERTGAGLPRCGGWSAGAGSAEPSGTASPERRWGGSIQSPVRFPGALAFPGASAALLGTPAPATQAQPWAKLSAPPAPGGPRRDLRGFLGRAPWREAVSRSPTSSCEAGGRRLPRRGGSQCISRTALSFREGTRVRPPPGAEGHWDPVQSLAA